MSTNLRDALYMQFKKHIISMVEQLQLWKLTVATENGIKEGVMCRLAYFLSKSFVPFEARLFAFHRS